MGRISGGQRRLQELVLPSTMDSKDLVRISQQVPSPTEQATISLVHVINLGETCAVLHAHRSKDNLSVCSLLLGSESGW